MFGDDDSVLLCITHFYVDLVCVFFNKENKKISFLDWYVIFSKADTSTNNIHKHGMYTFTNRRQGKAVNVFGHD